MTAWLGHFGSPPDAVAWAAVVLALLCAWCAWREPNWLRRALASEHHPKWVAALSGVAALLSLGYVTYYLRGGPRIIDATSYFLEARAFARGWFAFPVPEPLASFHGRFSLVSDHSTVGILFPPGYPAVLALGFLARVPLLVGPLIAGGIVVATHALAKELTARDDVALLAAGLSTVSAVLRYHTADTMSHGWCALLVAVAILAALRSGWRWWVLGGVAAGWLIASRPVSGLALAPLLAVALARKRDSWVPFGLALLPGLALLVLHQRAVTGQWLVSSQQLYYQLSDGPPGCFAYGFGPNVGCRFEHGDFVDAVMPAGFGWSEAISTTWGRVHTHLRDAANLQPVALVLIAGVAAIRRERRLLYAVGGIALLVAAYVPFYYSGSYPGGGARFYADVLPLEHVLLAQGFFLLRAWRAALPLALLGFATQTSFDHRALSTREGGRPMFESAVLRRAGVDHGLVFLTTDHGFNLAFDPGRDDPRHNVVFARLRGDANDRILWERLGRPPTYRYVYDPAAASAAPRLEPHEPEAESALRFEGEYLWPVRRIEGGWVHPTFPACASGRRGLLLHRAGRTLRVDSQLFVPKDGRYAILVGWAAVGQGRGAVRVELDGRGRDTVFEYGRGDCWIDELGSDWLPEGSQNVSVQVAGDGLVLDFIELRPTR